MNKTEYTTTVDNRVTYQGPSLERAIRSWDGETYNKPADGGIGVQAWMGEVMVRDGWVLHVQGGRAYMSPNLSDILR